MRKFIVVMMVLSLAAAAYAADKAQVAIGRLSDFPIGAVKIFAAHKIIVFSAPEGIYALSTECTHLKCALSFKKELHLLACPCHGSRFDEAGRVVRGPAARDLTWLSIEKNEKGELIVDKDKTVPAGTKFLFSP